MPKEELPTLGTSPMGKQEIDKFNENLREEIEDVIYPRYCHRCKHEKQAFKGDPCKDCYKFTLLLGHYEPL